MQKKFLFVVLVPLAATCASTHQTTNRYGYADAKAQTPPYHAENTTLDLFFEANPALLG